jgi:hypothetical protein
MITSNNMSIFKKYISVHLFILFIVLTFIGSTIVFAQDVNDPNPFEDGNSGGSVTPGGGGSVTPGGGGSVTPGGGGSVTPGGGGSVTPGGIGLPNPAAGKANNICDLLNAVINIVVELGALVGVLFIIWSGFLFIKAQGNTTQLDHAKRTFYTTIIGLAILLGASVITKIIFNTVSSITTAGGATSICPPK